MEKVNSAHPYRPGLYSRFFKRIFDIIFSLIGIIVLLPLFLLLACTIRLKLGSPVLFKQKRPGYHEKIFMLCKFRSMKDLRDSNGNLLSDSERLTPFGKFLRSTSVDELPELLNILKGDMSFVGPRPQLVKDMVFMNAKQRHRHDCVPGLTGLAQIKGRNGISWEEKLNYDLEYLRKISFLTDLKIFFLTIFKVFQRDGVNSPGMDTAEDFGDYLLRTHQISEDEYDKALLESEQLLQR